MIKKVALAFVLMSVSAYSSTITFSNAVEILQKHEEVETILSNSRAKLEEGGIKGSWSDPVFKIAAKNFPKDTLRDDQTPMTGIEFGVSQKVSLTTKYGNLKKSYNSLSSANEYEAKEMKQYLIKSLWEILISKRKITKELGILNENKIWINKILKVSKKLYANGKTSQQAILDIQIRRSEIDSDISNKRFELSQVEDQVIYLIGSSKVSKKTIPWHLLNHKASKIADNRDLSLREKLKSKEFSLKASKLNYIPDLTISLAITKRSNIDNRGDFVGASVSFPLPVSGEKYSKQNKAIHEKYTAVKNYENYKSKKTREASLAKKEVKKLSTEINILNNKTIKYANNSRSITSKSYALGNSTYVELLQSELKLQKILMHKIMLEAKRDIKKVALKYILGEPLNE